MINEEVRKTILSKIDFLIGGINDKSFRTDDLMIAQTIQALSEAYKNLERCKGEECDTPQGDSPNWDNIVMRTYKGVEEE